MCCDEHEPNPQYLNTFVFVHCTNEEGFQLLLVLSQMEGITLHTGKSPVYVTFKKQILHER